MKGYKFTALKQLGGWIKPAFVTVDKDGQILSVTAEPQHEIIYEPVEGLALPAFINAHSHAFQYAMAGMAEVHPPAKTVNDFWSWRSKMYQIALSLDPGDIKNIASMLYAELVRHGYGHVVEFHYLHHDKTGQPYSNIAETSEGIIEAAAIAGINITLVPILYENGGFGKRPENHQRRFISSGDQYANLLERCKKIAERYPHAVLGYGAHSLRAAGEDSIRNIIRIYKDEYPFHMHIAEQLREVEEAQQYLKKRPVEWLLDNVDLNENYHLVHATHLTASEVTGLASSGANVILCPTTEGNLGDGIFPFHSYQQRQGRWCTGTDSHISLNPLEEIRFLDYVQRLISHRRNTFTPAGGDNAAHALEQVIYNGRKAAGLTPGDDFFQPGRPFNAMVIDANHPLLTADTYYHIPTILYHFDVSSLYGTIINGRWAVKEGQHIQQEFIRQAFRQTLKKLKIRIG